MVLCWLYSYYANLNIPRERKNPAGYYHPCHRNSSTTVPLPDYPEQIFFFPPHFSCDLAKENSWTLWKLVSSNWMGWKIGIWSNKTIRNCILLPIKLLVNRTSEAFYTLRPHKGCSLKQLPSGLATMDKERLKRREIYFSLSFSQENTLHTEELVRIPWTQAIKVDFNRKLKYIPSSEYRLILSYSKPHTSWGVQFARKLQYLPSLL